MKGAKKHFSRALTLLLSVLIMLQTVTVPAFAAENATENIPQKQIQICHPLMIWKYITMAMVN